MPGRAICLRPTDRASHSRTRIFTIRTCLASVTLKDTQKPGKLFRRKFQKAQIILSDGPGLGETNARTPPPDRYFYSNPETAPLSEGLFLSEAPRMTVRKRITETFDRAIPGGGDVSVTLTAVSGQNPIRCSHVGGRGEVYRLSGTRRRSPPVWWADATRARARDGYVFGFTPGVIQRADGRVSGADRFTPSIIPRADAILEIAWALRLRPGGLHYRTTTAAADPTGVGGAGTRLRGPVWLSLYHTDRPGPRIALVGAMHKPKHHNQEATMAIMTRQRAALADAIRATPLHWHGGAEMLIETSARIYRHFCFQHIDLPNGPEGFGYVHGRNTTYVSGDDYRRRGRRADHPRCDRYDQ